MDLPALIGLIRAAQQTGWRDERFNLAVLLDRLTGPQATTDAVFEEALAFADAFLGTEAAPDPLEAITDTDKAGALARAMGARLAAPVPEAGPDVDMASIDFERVIRESREFLADALNDPDEYVRENAAGSFAQGAEGCPQYVEELIAPLLEDMPEGYLHTALKVLTALNKMAYPLRGLVIPLLRHGNQHIRLAAIDVVALMGFVSRDEAIGHLQGLLDDPDPLVVLDARQALWTLDYRPDPDGTLQFFLENFRAEPRVSERGTLALRGLFQMGEAAVPALTELKLAAQRLTLPVAREGFGPHGEAIIDVNRVEMAYGPALMKTLERLSQAEMRLIARRGSRTEVVQIVPLSDEEEAFIRDALGSGDSRRQLEAMSRLHPRDEDLVIDAKWIPSLVCIVTEPSAREASTRILLRRSGIHLLGHCGPQRTEAISAIIPWLVSGQVEVMREAIAAAIKMVPYLTAEDIDQLTGMVEGASLIHASNLCGILSPLVATEKLDDPQPLHEVMRGVYERIVRDYLTKMHRDPYAQPLLVSALSYLEKHKEELPSEETLAAMENRMREIALSDSPLDGFDHYIVKILSEHKRTATLLPLARSFLSHRVSTDDLNGDRFILDGLILARALGKDAALLVPKLEGIREGTVFEEPTAEDSEVVSEFNQVKITIQAMAAVLLLGIARAVTRGSLDKVNEATLKLASRAEDLPKAARRTKKLHDALKPYKLPESAGDVEILVSVGDPGGDIPPHRIASNLPPFRLDPREIDVWEYHVDRGKNGTITLVHKTKHLIYRLFEDRAASKFLEELFWSTLLKKTGLPSQEHHFVGHQFTLRGIEGQGHKTGPLLGYQMRYRFLEEDGWQLIDIDDANPKMPNLKMPVEALRTLRDELQGIYATLHANGIVQWGCLHLAVHRPTGRVVLTDFGSFRVSDPERFKRAMALHYFERRIHEDFNFDETPSGGFWTRDFLVHLNTAIHVAGHDLPRTPAADGPSYVECLVLRVAPQRDPKLMFFHHEHQVVRIPRAGKWNPWRDAFDGENIQRLEEALLGPPEDGQRNVDPMHGPYATVTFDPTVLDSPWYRFIKNEAKRYAFMTDLSPFCVHFTHISVPVIDPHALKLDAWQIGFQNEPVDPMPEVPLAAHLVYPEDRDSIKGVLVLIPGMAKTHQSIEELRLKLASEGYATLVVDWRATGYSADYAPLKDYSTLASDLGVILKEAPRIVERVLGRKFPMGVVSFSAGSTALLTSFERPEIVKVMKENYERIIPLAIAGYGGFGEINKTALKALQKAQEMARGIVDEDGYKNLPPSLREALAINLGSEARYKAANLLWRQVIDIDLALSAILYTIWGHDEATLARIGYTPASIMTRTPPVPEELRDKVMGFGHYADPFVNPGETARRLGAAHYRLIGQVDDAARFTPQLLHDVTSLDRGFRVLLRLLNQAFGRAQAEGPQLDMDLTDLQKVVAQTMKDHPEVYWEMDSVGNVTDLIDELIPSERHGRIKILFVIPRATADNADWTKNKLIFREGLYSFEPWRHCVIEVAGRIYDLDYQGKLGEPIDFYLNRMFPDQEVDLVSVPADEFLEARGDENPATYFLFDAGFTRWKAEDYSKKALGDFGRQEEWPDVEARRRTFERAPLKLESSFEEGRFTLEYERSLTGEFNILSFLKILGWKLTKTVGVERGGEIKKVNLTIKVPQGSEVDWRRLKGRIIHTFHLWGICCQLRVSFKIGDEAPLIHEEEVKKEDHYVLNKVDLAIPFADRLSERRVQEGPEQANDLEKGPSGKRGGGEGEGTGGGSAPAGSTPPVGSAPPVSPAPDQRGARGLSRKKVSLIRPTVSITRSHALRGNANRVAPRPGCVDAERPGHRSHGDRGNELHQIEEPARQTTATSEDFPPQDRQAGGFLQNDRHRRHPRAQRWRHWAGVRTAMRRSALRLVTRR